jgi:hypothetical protein
MPVTLKQMEQNNCRVTSSAPLTHPSDAKTLAEPALPLRGKEGINNQITYLSTLCLKKMLHVLLFTPFISRSEREGR